MRTQFGKPANDENAEMPLLAQQTLGLLSEVETTTRRKTDYAAGKPGQFVEGDVAYGLKLE